MLDNCNKKQKSFTYLSILLRSGFGTESRPHDRSSPHIEEMYLYMKCL